MINPFRTLFAALNDAGIRYLIVGGVAVNLHGYRRFTGDVDLLIALEEDNLEKMTELMHALGYIERLPVQLIELSNDATIQKFLDEKGMTAYTFLSNTHERIDVDILAGSSRKFAQFDDRKVWIDIDEGVTVPVIALNDLLTMKREANRDKDMIDIKALLESKGL